MQNAKIIARAIALANLADPAKNSNEAERNVALNKLIAHCEKHGLQITDYVKPVASPEAEPAPASEQPAGSIIAERSKAMQAFTRRFYAGASSAAHSKLPPKLADALARVASPVQRAKSLSERDTAALALAACLADASGAFCPTLGAFDLGILSRLASLGLLSVTGERITAKPEALDTGRAAIRKAGADSEALALRNAYAA
jgi:hypothetical protein